MSVQRPIIYGYTQHRTAHSKIYKYIERLGGLLRVLDVMMGTMDALSYEAVSNIKSLLVARA